MGLYGRYIFPRILDWTMSLPAVAEQRPRALAEAHGDVLEIGFGTGLNLPYYPAAVARLTAVDPSAALGKRVGRRIDAARMPVETLHHDAVSLPFDAGRFDCVTTTWTLCSIADVSAALCEIRRVLKPGGRYLFIEHGRSNDAKIARRQDRWNRLHRWIAGGCNLNRPIDRLIDAAGLSITRLERFDLKGVPRRVAPHYLGSATAM